MEIKVGVQHVNREVVVETTESAAAVEKAFAKALESGGLFTLTDERGRKILLPASQVGYLDIGEENSRRVGFGGMG